MLRNNFGSTIVFSFQPYTQHCFTKITVPILLVIRDSKYSKIIKKPIVVEDEVVVGNTLKSTLSADHRVLDGAVAGKLLKDFNDIIEDPFEIWIKSSDMEIL